MVLFAGSHFHAGVSVLWLPQNYVSDMDGGFRFFSFSFPSAILYIIILLWGRGDSSLSILLSIYFSFYFSSYSLALANYICIYRYLFFDTHLLS